MKTQKFIYRLTRHLLGALLLISTTLSLYRHYGATVTTDPMIGDKAAEISNCFWSTGYLMLLVKAIELFFALSLITNRYIKFTILLFCPILVNIVLFHIFTYNLKGLTVPFLMTCATGYLIYHNRDYYFPLFLKN